MNESLAALTVLLDGIVNAVETAYGVKLERRDVSALIAKDIAEKGFADTGEYPEVVFNRLIGIEVLKYLDIVAPKPSAR